MKRGCPWCKQLMQPLAVRGVAVDWCTHCRGLWFDRGELGRALGFDGAPTITREQPATRCTACKGLLWFSRVDGSDVLACVDCAGCFVTEAVLLQRGAIPSTGVEGTFICATCGDGYALDQGRMTAKGLECTRCAPAPPSPPAPLSTAQELLQALADFARRLVG